MLLQLLHLSCCSFSTTPALLLHHSCCSFSTSPAASSQPLLLHLLNLCCCFSTSAAASRTTSAADKFYVLQLQGPTCRWFCSCRRSNMQMVLQLQKVQHRSELRTTLASEDASLRLVVMTSSSLMLPSCFDGFANSSNHGTKKLMLALQKHAYRPTLMRSSETLL